MVSPDNIDSRHSSFQLDTRYSGCRRNLDYLLIYRTLRLIGLSQSALAGGKTATSNLIKNSATGKRFGEATIRHSKAGVVPASGELRRKYRQRRNGRLNRKPDESGVFLECASPPPFN